ncbi:MAG: SLBB domain-containing protein [Sphingomonas sp.]
MTSFSSFARLLIVGAIAIFMSGALAAQQAPVAPPAASPAASPAQRAAVTLADGYVLGVGDVVEVAVLGREEFRSRIQVQTDGTIQLPYLKSVPAIDLTVLQLRDNVRKLLLQGGFYTDPVVNVAVVNYASRYVTVLGEVGTPGLLAVDKAYHVSEVLAKVGGARASGDDQIVLTRTTGEQVTLSVERVASGAPSEDPLVNPGDKMFIAVAPSFYIYGQVGAPGSYKVERDMSLRKALARGGGLTDRGSERKVKVFRDGKQVGKVDLSMLIKGGDTVVVGERFF